MVHHLTGSDLSLNWQWFFTYWHGDPSLTHLTLVTMKLFSGSHHKVFSAKLLVSTTTPAVLSGRKCRLSVLCAASLAVSLQSIVYFVDPSQAPEDYFPLKGSGTPSAARYGTAASYGAAECSETCRKIVWVRIVSPFGSGSHLEIKFSCVPFIADACCSCSRCDHAPNRFSDGIA